MDVGEKVKSFMSYFTQPSVKNLIGIANVFGVLYFWIVSTTVIYVNLFSIIPIMFVADPFWLQFHWWVFTLATFGMFLNYFICLRKRSTYAAPTTGGEVGDPTAKGWGHCVPCQQYTPPRAHHCPVCRKCILKRDMHCFFLGVCVGHFNQRYFLVFLFYAALAALHASMCFFAYLNHDFVPLFSWGAYNYLYPIVTVKWMLGFVPSYSYFILGLFYMCLVLGIGCSGMFYFHMRRVLACQTTHEFAYRVTTFSRGSRRNLQEVFGSHWWLAFLLPVPMTMTSDGVVWNKPKEVKGY